jgi:hypothetical protein
MNNILDGVDCRFMSHLNRSTQTMRRLNEAFHLPDISWVSKMIDEWIKSPDEAVEISKRYSVNLKNLLNNEEYLLAAYNLRTKEYDILLSANAIDDIDNGIKMRLVKDVESAIIHENTHHQQDQGKFDKQSIIHGEDNYYGYLSQTHEISAFARMFAYEIKRLQKTDEKTLQAIKEQDLRGLSISNKTVFKDYQEIGGKVYRKLLDEMYRFITEV